MKLRALRQWPALFVAVLAFFTGPMTYGADERAVTAFVSDVLPGVPSDRELQATLDTVVALCRNAAGAAHNGHPDARGFRELADAIDTLVTQAMDRLGESSARHQRALAGLVLAAEAMRSTDNRIRKAALSGLAHTHIPRGMAAARNSA